MDLLSDTISRTSPKAPRHPPAREAQSAVDLGDPIAFRRHGPPWEAFAELRRRAPVAWQEQSRFGGAGFWAVTSYEAVMRVNGDPETFSSQRGGIMMGYGEDNNVLTRASLDTMICMDAPWHMQLRREHMPYFTPRYLADLKLKVAAETRRLIDDMAPLGSCDLVERLSSRLPLFTLCEILGVPEADREKFLTWMHYLELASNAVAEFQEGALEVTPELAKFVQDFQVNVREMFEYGRAMLHKRRRDPQPDLMSAIAAARVDGELLPDAYLDGSWLLIVFAGNDTTRNTISGSVKLLTEFPDQRELLLNDRSLIPGAVNEFIRMVSPVIYMRRTVTREVEIEGQRLSPDEKVVMFYGAANRDETLFQDPDRLDVRRPNADKHIAFGYGPHVCLGKRVAQLQLEVVHEQLLERLPDIAYTGGVEYAPSNFVYAIQKLPVSFTPERKAG